MTQWDNPRVGLSGIAHHVWDPDTSTHKKWGWGFWVQTHWCAQVKSPTGPSATEEEVTTACWSGWCILVLCTNGNSFDTETRNSLPAMKTQWRLDKCIQFYNSITDSCSSHKYMMISSDLSRCTSSYLLGDFLDGF